MTKDRDLTTVSLVNPFCPQSSTAHNLHFQSPTHSRQTFQIQHYCWVLQPAMQCCKILTNSTNCLLHKPESTCVNYVLKESDRTILFNSTVQTFTVTIRELHNSLIVTVNYINVRIFNLFDNNQKIVINCETYWTLWEVCHILCADTAARSKCMRHCNLLSILSPECYMQAASHN